jgi:hypothetical protein
MSNRSTPNPVQAAASRTAVPKTYVEWHDAFPTAEPTVKVTFHGLFCFFFDGKDECFVGTHNTTQQPGHPHTTHPHEYVIVLRQKDGGATTSEETFPVGNPQRFPRLNFKATGSAFPGGVEPGVYVYTGPNHDQFDRLPGNDMRDWRWIIDFDDIYPDGVKGLSATAVRPGLKFDDGLFYTEHKTDSTFRLVPEGGGDEILLNNVAEIQGVNIYLANGGFVKLTGGPVGERRLDFAAGRTYEVEITNLCDGNVHPACHYEPDDLDKQRRNDFFLYYDTFDPAQNRPEYLLIKQPDSRATDESPCGAVGFGGSPQP